MPTHNPNVTGPTAQRVDGNLMGCGWAWIWFWLFIVLIAFAGWGWGGWYGGWGGPWGAWGPRPMPMQNYPQQQAMEPRPSGTNEFVGRTVTVSGQVDQVLGKGAFTLASGDGGQPLLVIRKDDKAPAVKQGEKVQVTGKVERYDRDDLHKQTGADLNDVPAGEFGGRPAVVASSVAPSSSSS